MSESRVFSQNGEDGLLAGLLDAIPEEVPWCVEFGAGDGESLSNSRNLILERGYSAVLIEPDPTRYRALERLYAEQPHITTLKAFVGFTPEDNLDRLLERTAVPHDFSVLSIDIDGNDFHAWEAITEYRPRVLCIEYNQTIPTDVHFVQPADPAVMHGASLTALVELGTRKGYELVAVLYNTATFVRAEYFSLFGIPDNSPAALRKDCRDVTHVFLGYDGTVLFSGALWNPWHRIRLQPWRMQRLPRHLRRYPTSYGRLRWAAFAVYIVVTEPGTAVAKIGRTLRRLVGKGWRTRNRTAPRGECGESNVEKIETSE